METFIERPPEPTDNGFNVTQGDDDDNVLEGDEHDNWILGHGGDDTLIGKGGSDILEGGDGDDTLTGDEGNPLSATAGYGFRFDRDDGTDTITNFRLFCPACVMAPNTSLDHIFLKRGTPAEVDAAVQGATATPEGNAVVTYGDTKIILEGYQPSEVKDYWFIAG